MEGKHTTEEHRLSEYQATETLVNPHRWYPVWTAPTMARNCMYSRSSANACCHASTTSGLPSLQTGLHDQHRIVSGTQGQQISSPLICEKALEMNKKLGGISDFKVTTGWLMHFKSIHGIRELDIQGEELLADTEAAEHFKESFRNMIDKEDYTKTNVKNSDETDVAGLIKESSGFEERDQENIQDWLECDIDDSGYQVLMDDEIIASVIMDQDPCDDEKESSSDCIKKDHPVRKLFTAL
ncbi:hypothetical protein PR048_006871 [Dryococelus australis]|uniref:HTH CENPB-type domain-containing protein n=1 Tax=Dryococelus australis TaxID=614101 RepID=A0ABQ9IC54_9NEOP|nr:hypothetical protein PR048_006871 [Dryococelus australis]